eukprot:2249572-Prymnesium_polylepis.1
MVRRVSVPLIHNTTWSNQGGKATQRPDWLKKPTFSHITAHISPLLTSSRSALKLLANRNATSRYVSSGRNGPG